MENCLDKIVDFLKRNPVELLNNNDDGRINSATNEIIVLQAIQNNFDNIEIPGTRSWYDFSIINQSNEKIFINIKISDLYNESPDNCSSKRGMGYALCGNENMSNQWQKFHTELVNNLKLGYDYYFLVINKQKPEDCFYTSLKKINKLIPNGNNLPFQCDWSKNRLPSKRTEKEAIKYILEIYIESWNKKTMGYPLELSTNLDKIINAIK